MDIVNDGYEVFKGLRRIYRDIARRHPHSIRTMVEQGRQGALDWMVAWS